MADDLKLNFVLSRVTALPAAEQQPLPSCSPSVRLEEVLQEEALVAGTNYLGHHTGCIVAVYLLSNVALTREKKCLAQFIYILRVLCVNNCKLWIKDLYLL